MNRKGPDLWRNEICGSAGTTTSLEWQILDLRYQVNLLKVQAELAKLWGCPIILSLPQIEQNHPVAGEGEAEDAPRLPF